MLFYSSFRLKIQGLARPRLFNVSVDVLGGTGANCLNVGPSRQDMVHPYQISETVSAWLQYAGTNLSIMHQQTKVGCRMKRDSR